MKPADQMSRPGVDSASKQRLRVWIRLLRTTRYLEAELRERLRAMDMTLPRFDVLAALDRAQGPMTMTELSRYLMVSNGNVTGIIDRLVEDRLVTRTQKERDRRASMVELTGRGRAVFADLARDHEVWVDRLLAPIDMTDANKLLDILSRYDRARRKGEGR